LVLNLNRFVLFLFVLFVPNVAFRNMSRYSFASVVTFSLSVLLCVSSVRADDPDHGVTFQYPINDMPDVHYLDSVNVSWTSNFSSPKMFTFCANAVSGSTITGMFSMYG